MEEIRGPSPLVPGWLARWPVALGLFALVTLLALAGLYLEHFGRMEPAGIALAVIILPLGKAAVLAPWAGLWAVAGRVLRQKTYFWAHVSVPLLALLAYTVLGWVFGLGLFAVDMDRLLLWVSLLVFWAIAVWTIGAHLHWVSRRSFRWIWIAAFVSVTTLCGLFAGLGYLFMKTFGAQPEKPVSLSPYFLRVVPPKSPAEHLAPIARLRGRVDKEAADLAHDLK